jgi:hypothetical protein
MLPLPTSPALPSLYISIPAWGTNYIDTAMRYTVPAIFASLQAAAITDPVNFIIYTDDEPRFTEALAGYNVIFRQRLAVYNKREAHWPILKAAHRDSVVITPVGSILCLLNADIVVSRETFAFARDTFAANATIKAIVTYVGIRTVLDHDKPPPIGVSASELSQWIWQHKHSIIKELIWDSGRSGLPTLLLFEHEDGMSMHNVHLTPMFLRKDARVVNFRGTIDDDLLELYRDEECFFVCDGQIAGAELSPITKVHPVGRNLSIAGMIEYWQRRGLLPSQVRNFRNRISILGNPRETHPAAERMIKGLAGVRRPWRR